MNDMDRAVESFVGLTDSLVRGGATRAQARIKVIRRYPWLASAATFATDSRGKLDEEKGRKKMTNSKKVASLLATLLSTDDEEKINEDEEDEENDKPGARKACQSCGRFAGQGDGYCRNCGAKILDDDDDGSTNRSGSSGRAAQALYAMEQRVQQIVSASGGKLTKPQAYAQLLATPEGQQLYTRYDRERENASLTRDGREQYARSMHALMQGGGYGTMPSGITDNLPQR